MSQLVLVRGTKRSFDCIAAIVVGFGLSAFLLLLPGALTPMGRVLVGGGSAMALIGLLVLIVRKRGIACARDLGDRLELHDRHGKSIVCDEAVVAAAGDHRMLLSIDISTIQRRVWKLRVVEASRLRDLTLATDYPAGESDPLQDYLQRIMNRLTTEAESKWQAGKSIEGDGWELDTHELRMTGGRSSHTFALHEISAVDMLDRQACIWLNDREVPVIRIPQTGLNNLLLIDLLFRNLPQLRREAQTQQSRDLGRRLYERRAGWPTLAVVWLFFVIFCVVVGFLLLKRRTADPQDASDILIFSSLFALFALLTAACAISMTYLKFQFFERGVRRLGLLSERTLSFDDAEALTIESRPLRYFGLYLGTRLTMAFEPSKDSRGRSIAYSTLNRRGDQIFITIRKKAATIIGRRMARAVLAGERVEWTPNMHFEFGRLHYTEKGIFGSKQLSSIAYDRIDRIQISDEIAALFTPNSETSFHQESTNERNFHPGMICWWLLCHQHSDDPETRAAARL